MSSLDPTSLKVVVVGAGFGGLGIGVALKNAGIHRFMILESGNDVGGVWRDNTYPGCTCDVPSHLYSFHFAPWSDPVIRYPEQRQILDYLRSVTDRFVLGQHLQLNARVLAATYSDGDGRWTIDTDDGRTYRAESLIWAVGQLHNPHLPDIAGRTGFTGPAFHSARWDHSAVLADREVAIVGTGSSAAQIVPHLARTARHVRVFQRSPAWVLPKPAPRFGPVTRAALARVPALHPLYRAALYQGTDLLLPSIMIGGWSARPARWAAHAHLWCKVRDPQLRSRLTPRYRIGEKRIVLDNDFYPAMTRPNVELVTTPIDHVTAGGITTVDGVHHSVDAIVWATGFTASQFLAGISVRGRGGMELAEQWADAATAYMGLAVPGFPSMWLVAGPNSFTPAGSNPSLKAFQTRYIIAGIHLSERLGAPIEVSPEAMARYQRWLRAAIARTVWPTGTHSWFKNSTGVVTNPWPLSSKAFDRATRTDPAPAFIPVEATAKSRVL
ncbi:flavin-containing monooxygenase [Nocardia sp. NPDC052566]|uniref:flavin-containing monooxygenase n=1 Tax=Nocardia sp. NPDC052566 TaxID=3364330 RepID=UPI0037C8B9F7